MPGTFYSPNITMFGSGSGNAFSNLSAGIQENDAYRAQLEEWKRQRERERQLERAAQIQQWAQQHGDQVYGPNLLEQVTAEQAGMPNENGYIDPRMTQAYQQMSQAQKMMLASGIPELQDQALGNFRNQFNATVPEAPAYPRQQTELTPDILEYQYAVNGGYGGSFEDWQLAMGRSRQTQVNVGGPNVSYGSDKYETEYDKTLGKQQAEDFIQLQKAPQDTAVRLRAMEDLNGLLGDRGGFLGSNLKQLKMVASRLGLNIEGLDADQAAEALGNQLTLTMRNTASGAGMPGAMSDADRNFLARTVPSIDMTPAGRMKYVEIQRRMLLRQQEVADAARNYAAANNGRVDYRFNSELERIRSRDLFGDLDIARPDPKPSGITNFRRVR